MADIGDLKLFDEWYKAVIWAGGALAVAAVAGAHTPALITGVGLTLFGIGEFINHPYQSRLIREHGFSGVAHGRVRNAKAFGLVVDAVGLCLLAYGLWRIVSA